MYVCSLRGMQMVSKANKPAQADKPHHQFFATLKATAGIG